MTGPPRMTVRPGRTVTPRRSGRPRKPQPSGAPSPPLLQEHALMCTREFVPGSFSSHSIRGVI